MRKMLLISLCMTLMATSALAEKEEKIKELLEVSFGSQMQLEKMLSQSFKMTANDILCRYSLNKADETSIQNRLNNLTNTENFTDSYVRFYADNYTEEEIDELLQFYKSPVIQKSKTLQPQLDKYILQKQQEVSRNVMPAMTKIRSELQTKYPQRSTTEYSQCLAGKIQIKPENK